MVPVMSKGLSQSRLSAGGRSPALTEVCPLDLRDGVVLQLVLVGVCRVQPEAFAWGRAASTSRSLLSRGFADRGDTQCFHASPGRVPVLLAEAGVDDVLHPAKLVSAKSLLHLNPGSQYPSKTDKDWFDSCFENFNCLLSCMEQMEGLRHKADVLSALNR